MVATAYLAFGLRMKGSEGGMSPPPSEPNDGPLDMLQATGKERGELNVTSTLPAARNRKEKFWKTCSNCC
jgi:hypothetical protein